MLNNKDYCDYDTCVALEEIGCSYLSNDKVYVGKSGLYCKCTPPYNSQKYNEGELLSPFYILGCYKEVGTTIPAIPLYEAQKWLREVKKLHITIFSQSQESWQYRITKQHQKLEDGLHGEDFASFEEALLKGIKEAVKILKEK